MCNWYVMSSWTYILIYLKWEENCSVDHPVLNHYCFHHADPNLWDHLNLGTGIWSGLPDGGPVQSKAVYTTFISAFRAHWNQNQSPCLPDLEQHAEISSEWHTAIEHASLCVCCLWLFFIYSIEKHHSEIILKRKLYTVLMTSPSEFLLGYSLLWVWSWPPLYAQSHQWRAYNVMNAYFHLLM